MTAPETAWTISIDAGGTFTDAVGRSSSGQIRVAKVASTPDDPARGLANAVAALAGEGVPLDQVSLICHGTTVATNAMLTSSMARVVLLTTQGFRDVLAYRTGSRPDVYSLTPTPPRDLVTREDRLEVRERISADRKVLVELTDDEIGRLVTEVAAMRPDAVAVSLLFSYVNSEHEERLGEALRTALPGVPVSVSSEVVREFREYPRTATTAINAALRPVVGAYLESAGDQLRAIGANAPLQVMQSNGGCVPAPRASIQAHRLLLSGPVGGVSGLLEAAATHGVGNMISLDMGGTSVDICLVRDGLAPYTNTQTVSDHTVLAPTVDIHTIGAGGGSIAWLDRGHRLRIGPRSAKAVPGPACYGRGGTEPTLTDAHVVLGNLGTDALAGGLQLDAEAARTAVRTIADPLGMTVDEAAEAIVAIAVAHMVRGVRKVSVERGLDPREFTLVPFGGAGPLHAGLLLRHLGLRSVIVPARPGLFSASGLLAAGLRMDESQTVLELISAPVLDDVAAWLAEREGELRAQAVRDGADPELVRSEISADCRYLGQGYELPVRLTGGAIEDLQDLASEFHAAHDELYGHSSPDEPVELVTVRIAVVGSFAPVEDAGESGSTKPDSRPITHRTVRFPGADPMLTPVMHRDSLTPGSGIDGPAVIAQMDATTVLLPGNRAVVAANGDLIITEGDDHE